MRSWDCSQIENEEERKLEEILAHRRMEGSSLQEVMRKVPELVEHERMSQGKGVKGFKEKWKVSGWSTKEMRERPSIALEIDTGGIRKWRGLSQSEVDQCLKNLAGRVEEEVTGQVQSRRQQKKEAFSGRGAPLEWRRVRKNKTYRIRKRSEDLAGQELSLCLKRTVLERQYSRMN